MSIPSFGPTLVKRAMDLANKAYTGLSAFTDVKVVKYSEENYLHHPCWFIVEDGNDVFEVVRVSGSDIDWETDLDFTEIQGNYGGEKIHTHGGFYNSGKNVFSEMKATLKGYSGKNIYVTGHSLGGSVSKVLGLMIMTDSETKNLNSYVLSFAPAPALAYIPTSVNKRFAMFVNNEDVITTLSIPNGHSLVNGAMTTASFIPSSVVKAAIKGAVGLLKNVPADFAKSLLKALENNIDKIVDAICAYHEDNTTAKVKNLIGTIYHFTSTSSTKLADIVASPSDFQTIHVSISACTDHTPENYVKKVNALTA